jgi:hypothetical protein
MWLELIGFDNEQADFGVGAFLDNAGLVPEVISLLMFNADFIHTHDGLEQDRIFPPDYCSYAAHPCNDERQRQDWSQRQLLSLVRELQKHGVRVYVSVFDIFVTQEWIGKHRELLHFSARHGNAMDSVCPWKRFRDGSYYEDFFIKQLVGVMRDYGFDGFHGADGYAHPRIAIYDGDFSDDMVEQFVQATGQVLPETMRDGCGDDASKITARADWIWRNIRREWIAFYAERIQAFWRKVVEAVHAEEKQVVLNTAWTRDPFEALYRYGIDYQALTRIGVDGFLVESAAAALETMERGEASCRILCKFMAAILLNKAYVAEPTLRWLNGVKDVQEQWSAMRHAPTALESEVYSLSNLYWTDHDGQLKRCVTGPVVCLADGLKREEWQWLQQIWEIGFSMSPARVLGATLVWSDGALKNQLDDFIATRRWTTHRLLSHLIAGGAPIQSVVRSENLDVMKGAIVALNVHLFPQKEIEKILAYRNGPIILIGTNETSLPLPGFSFEDGPSPDQLRCSVYNSDEKFEVDITHEVEEKRTADPMEIKDPASWLNELDFQNISSGFLKNCCKVISLCGCDIRILKSYCGHGAPMKTDLDMVRLLAMEDETGKIRLLISNDDYVYSTTQIDMGHGIADIKLLTGLVSSTVKTDGSTFSVKIPPRGMVVMDVKTIIR